MSRLARDFDRFKEQPVPIVTGPLSGGMSRQPSDGRFGNQLESSINADHSPFGAHRRAGSVYRPVVSTGTIASMVANGDYRLHAIDRDDREQYLVLRGVVGTDMKLRVFERVSSGSWLEATVNYVGTAQAYLNHAGAPPAEIKLSSVTDTTFVLNARKPVALIASPNYTVEAVWDDADTMVAQTPAVNSYHRARADGVDLAAGYYQYTPNVDGRTFPTYAARIYDYTDWGKLRGDWDNAANSPSVLRIGFRRQNLAVTGLTVTDLGGNEWELKKTGSGAFATLNLESTDMARVAAGTGNLYINATYGWSAIIRKPDNDTIVVRASAAGAPTWGVGRSAAFVSGATDVAIDGIGREFELSIDIAGDIAGGTINNMTDIADRFQQEFRAVGGDDVLVAWVPSLNGNGAFQVTGPWKGVDAFIYAPLTPIGGTSSGDMSVDDRPFSSTLSEVTRVNGDGGTSGAGAIRQPIAERWTKVFAPNQPRYNFDASSMPHKLVRTSFTGNGTTPAVFSVQPIAWNAREAGDEETNDAMLPFKEGKTIKAVSLFQDRLALGTENSVCFSQAGNLFKFYLEDETVVADSDRIYAPLSAAQVPTIYAMLPYRKSLMVLTQPEQVFEIGGESFTPSTFSVTLGPSFPATIHEPVMSGIFAYIIGNPLAGATGRQTAALYRIAYDDIAASSIGENVADHVPDLVESASQRIVAMPGEGWHGILPPASSLFYVLRTYFAGNREVIRAWSIYQLDRTMRIVDMVNIRNELHFIVERVTRDDQEIITSSSGQYTFESIRIQPDTSIKGPLAIRLDRQTTLSGTFDGTHTNYTLPYTDSTINKVVVPSGAVLDLDRPSGTAARVTGDQSGTATLGRSYNTDLVLGEQFIRYDNGIASLASRPFISAMRVRLRRSGGISAQIRRANNELVTRTWAPDNDYTPLEHTWTVRPLGMSDMVSITLTTASFRPVNIQSVEFISRGTASYKESDKP